MVPEGQVANVQRKLNSKAVSTPHKQLLYCKSRSPTSHIKGHLIISN